MVYLKTNFFPYRLVLARKQPVQLSIEIQNNEGKDKHFVMEVEVPRALGLESSGPKCMDTKQIGLIANGASKRFYYDIYGKAASMDTAYPVTVKLHEIIPGSRDIVRTTASTSELTVQGK